MKKTLLTILSTIVLIGISIEAKAVSYYLKTGGNPTVLTDWFRSSTVSGSVTPNPVSFNVAGDKFYLNQFNNSVTLTSPWTLGSPANSNIYVGRATGSNVGKTFTIASGGNIIQANINVPASTILYVQCAALSVTSTLFATSGKVVYNGAIPQTMINTALYKDLTISTTGGSASASGPLLVTGVLNITTDLILSNFSLELQGTLTGAGTITGDNIASMSLNGTAGTNLGTLIFKAGSQILNSLTFLSDCSVTLGTDLLISGGGAGSTFDQTVGSINLNGKVFTLDVDNTTIFSGLATSTFSGSASSVLNVNSLSITGNLMMDAINNSLKVLTVNNAGAALVIGNTLNILDSVQVLAGSLDCAGFLTLKSTAALKARIAQIGGTVLGNINVEMFVPGGVSGWRTLGAPGINGLTIGSWDGGSGSSTSFAMTCANCINNSNSAGGYFVSVQGDPSGTGAYTELTTASAITPGSGVWLYDANSLTTSIDVTLTKTGSIVTGAVASGTGFMANPYPSPISIDRLQSHAGITQVDLYNENTGAYTSYTGGVPSSGVIPMGQGFYASGATNITFQESDKVSYNTASYSILKTASSSTIGTVFQLNVAGASSSDFDQTYIRFHANGTPNFDNGLDAYKRYATPGYMGYPGPYTHYTTINTLASNMDYAINSLPYATSVNAVIPVKVKVSVTGTYSIIPVDIANLPPAACVTLKDKLLNITHDLRTGAYVCSIADTTSAPRFELTICADITAGINNSAVIADNTLINQDVNGAYVKTSFETNTKATISAYNVMGQKLMADKEIEGKDLTTYLDLGDVHSQVVIIRVTTAKTNTTKKIFIN